jgi:hypothetical protein
MHMTTTGKLLPFMMKKLVNKYLDEYYSESEIKRLSWEAGKNYKAIIGRVPDLGGKGNMMLLNVYLGAYIIALYRLTREKIDLPAFGKIIENGCRELVKKRIKGFDWFGEKNQKRLTDGVQWSKENGVNFPWAWQFTMLEDAERNGIHIIFTRCGLCKLCAAEGVPEFTPLLCATDFVTAEMAGVRLEREKTLATGDDCCDFLYLRN